MLDTPTNQANRKDDHVTHALAQYITQQHDDFTQTRFVHHSFPEINETDVSLQSTLATLPIETPFFINAMTGGSTQTKLINEQLAIIAKETQLAMATGSNSIILKDANTLDSFKVARQINPNGLLLANLGSHHNAENAQKVVDLLEANAIQIHTNTAQEIIMPEGERAFNGWLKNIEDIVKTVHVPVIVKEVGFGMSKETIQQLASIGVSTIDISGRGGTNFAQIENARRHAPYELLNNWGQSTLESLLEARFAVTSNNLPVSLIASGGIKTSYAIALCLALGADAVGLSGHLLYYLQQNGVDATITHINQLKEELRVIMTLLGTPTIKDLKQTDIVLSPNLRHWCQERGLTH